MTALIHDTKRRVALLMLTLAAITGLVLPCVCAAMTPRADVEQSEHSCCATQEGLRPNVVSCCEDHLEAAAAEWTATVTTGLAAPDVTSSQPTTVLHAAVPPAIPPHRPLGASPPLRI
jgi:hypothetical protein